MSKHYLWHSDYLSGHCKNRQYAIYAVCVDCKPLTLSLTLSLTESKPSTMFLGLYSIQLESMCNERAYMLHLNCTGHSRYATMLYA